MLVKIWNAKLERWEWEDLAYSIGEADKPHPLHGQPVEPKPDDNPQ